MHTLILQDWTTIEGSGTGTGASIVQGANEWLDVSAYQDAVVWLEVTSVTGTISMAFETAPTADDALFTTVVSGNANLSTLGVGTVVVPVFMMGAAIPIARFIRWHLTSSSSPWQATFRVFVAVNPPIQ